MVVTNFLLHYMLSLVLADKPNMLDLYKLYLATYNAVVHWVEALRY
jgi:hypothetical protein